jgi:hypothetical protein
MVVESDVVQGGSRDDGRWRRLQASLIIWYDRSVSDGRHRCVAFPARYIQAQEECEEREEREGHEGYEGQEGPLSGSRKSKKSAHMQGMRRSGNERLWRDELTLFNRSKIPSDLLDIHQTAYPSLRKGYLTPQGPVQQRTHQTRAGTSVRPAVPTPALCNTIVYKLACARQSAKLLGKSCTSEHATLA